MVLVASLLMETNFDESRGVPVSCILMPYEDYVAMVHNLKIWKSISSKFIHLQSAEFNKTGTMRHCHITSTCFNLVKMERLIWIR